MRTKTIVVYLIQLVWIGGAFFIGHFCAKLTNTTGVLFGLLTFVFAVVAYIVSSIIFEAVIAFKDPDLQEASTLRMSVTRYRIYKAMWDEIQEIYKENGIDSPATSSQVSKIIQRAPNLNEWRRFGEYQSRKTFEKLRS